MGSMMFAVAAVGFFVAAWIFGLDSHHFVAAGFCFAFGAAATIRSIVVLGAGDKKKHPHMQSGF